MSQTLIIDFQQMHYEIKLKYKLFNTFSVASMLNMSFLISSYTKFFLSSGAIYKAFTLRDSKTLYIMY